MNDDDRRMVRLHNAHLRRVSASEVTRHAREGHLLRLREATNTPLRDISPEQLEAWQHDLRGRLAIASVRTYTSHVRAFYAWAAHVGQVPENPAVDLLTPKVPMGRPRPIAEDRLRVSIACAPEPLRTWLILAAYLGLRAGEVARLTRESIDDETLDVLGKGAKWRTVPLPADVRDMLLAHVQGPGPIWRQIDGRPMSAGSVSWRCCKHLRDTGAEAVMHQLRHRFGTQAYRVSNDLRVVQDMLGHASPATTAIYVAADASKGKRTTDELVRGLMRGNPRRPRRRADLAEPAGPRLGETAGDEPRPGAA